MGEKLQLALNWSEVWALFIPLVALLFAGKQPLFLRPVIIYLCVAFIINLVGDIIGDFKKYLPAWLQSNNPLYNIHSVLRFACFAYFFVLLRQPHFSRVKKILPLISLLFLVINFTFFENFFNPESISGNLLTTEAYLLLVYCVLYYLSQLRDDDDRMSEKADFWVVTGLSIYVVINFFVFLFYGPMLDTNADLADKMWSVHNVAYIILCSFIAKGFYAAHSN